MASINQKYRFFLFTAIFIWIFLLVTDGLIIFGRNNNISFGIASWIPSVLLSFFSLSVMMGARVITTRSTGISFNELLWKAFSTAAITVFIFLCLRFFILLLDDSILTKNQLFITFFYHITLGLIIFYASHIFYVWKRLILFQRSQTVEILWNIFEYGVLASVFFFLLPVSPFTTTFFLILIPYVFAAILLASNLKWVAYLNYKQKWRSILLIGLVLIIGAVYWYYLYTKEELPPAIPLLTNNFFVLTIHSFIFLYCISAILVLFFNLPTSSVFEQKYEELLSFQKLSESIQIGKDEKEVYEIILDSSITTVIADAAWIEIFDEKGNFKDFRHKEINPDDIFEIKKLLRKNAFKTDYQSCYLNHLKKHKTSGNIQNLPYRSLLVVPIIFHNRRLGKLALLKKVKDGFDREMRDVINNFANHAGITLENFRLLSEQLENERYKEELNIARNVQRSLLPSELATNEHVEMAAFSQSPDEVGGDYYDSFRLPGNRIALVIGDVSGHGTTAAFNLAQVKGVFHSLVQLNISVWDFIYYANSALSDCLEKKSFITLSFFIIDFNTNIISTARAGHCPTLFYDASKGKACFIEDKGLALGILRDEEYKNHIHPYEFNFKTGDLLLLYTDGIVEAPGENSEAFGYERLKEILDQNHHLSPQEISEKIKERLERFMSQEHSPDDYTFVITKFL